MNCKKFGDLTDDEIKSVMQLTYQLIASANYGRISEADDSSIDIMMDKLGFTGQILETLGNAYWNDAIYHDPFVSFGTVSKFSPSKKSAFKELILAVAQKSNTYLRMDIASQIFSRTGI